MNATVPSIAVRIEPTETILNLKRKIFAINKDLAVERLSLIYSSRKLDDHLRIDECGIQDYGTIHFILRADENIHDGSPVIESLT
jgi:hypothetical protein